MVILITLVVFLLFDEGLLNPIFDAQMSPKKALRAAMLRSRFADTILKAQQKTLLDHVSFCKSIWVVCWEFCVAWY